MAVKTGEGASGTSSVTWHATIKVAMLTTQLTYCMAVTGKQEGAFWFQ